MEKNRPVREEDNKVVMSKLPRDEFSNFKKICDSEKKTINKKLRELINKEINENFGFAVEVNGTKKRFFIPAESKFLDVIETDILPLKEKFIVKIKEDQEEYYKKIESNKKKWNFKIDEVNKNVQPNKNKKVS